MVTFAPGNTFRRVSDVTYKPVQKLLYETCFDKSLFLNVVVCLFDLLFVTFKIENCLLIALANCLLTAC